MFVAHHELWPCIQWDLSKWRCLWPCRETAGHFCVWEVSRLLAALYEVASKRKNILTIPPSSVSFISLHFNSHFFQVSLGLAGFIGAKDDGSGGDNWSYKTCKAPVKSSPPATQNPVFYTPDALPVTQSTVEASMFCITWDCRLCFLYFVKGYCCWQIYSIPYRVHCCEMMAVLLSVCLSLCLSVSVCLCVCLTFTHAYKLFSPLRFSSVGPASTGGILEK